MGKLVWLLMGFVVLAYGRENPFETVASPSSVGKTTQIKEKRGDFESTTIKLPSSARIVKSVSIAFQNLDGSISEEITAIDQNINWHNPLVLSTQKPEGNNIVLAPQAPVAVKQSSEKKVLPAQEAPLKKGTLFKLGEGIAFDIEKNEIKVWVKDLKMRDFLVTAPCKIVVDFEKKSSFSTKVVDFKMPPFVSATLGDHDGFYRIAILLDGHYRYDIIKIENGYLIKLK